MPKQHSRSFRLREITSFLVAGLGIGCLMGLSASPVVSMVITALFSILTGVFAAFAGQPSPRTAAEGSAPGNDTIDAAEAAGGPSHAVMETRPEPLAIGRVGVPFPVNVSAIALLIAATVIGSLVGLWIRTHDLLAPRPETVIDEWSKRGVPRIAVASRLFDQLYPPAGPAGKGKDEPAAVANPNLSRTILFSVPVDECARLLAAPTPEIRKEMVSSTESKLRSLASIRTDEKTLAAVVSSLCASDSTSQ